MKCLHCQIENPEGAQFCGTHGKSFQTGFVCSKCGYANPQNFIFCNKCGHSLTEQPTSSTESTSFAAGRYQVNRFLGEGGKKKVYLAHDTELDRDVVFALIKTEKMDDAVRTRIRREVQAMGRLGDHPDT